MSAKLCAVFVPNILPGAGAWYTGAETWEVYDGVYDGVYVGVQAGAACAVH